MLNLAIELRTEVMVVSQAWTCLLKCYSRSEESHSANDGQSAMRNKSVPKHDLSLLGKDGITPWKTADYQIAKAKRNECLIPCLKCPRY